MNCKELKTDIESLKSALARYEKAIEKSSSSGLKLPNLATTFTDASDNINSVLKKYCNDLVARNPELAPYSVESIKAAKSIDTFKNIDIIYPIGEDSFIMEAEEIDEARGCLIEQTGEFDAWPRVYKMEIPEDGPITKVDITSKFYDNAMSYEELSDSYANMQHIAKLPDGRLFCVFQGYEGWAADIIDLNNEDNFEHIDTENIFGVINEVHILPGGQILTIPEDCLIGEKPSNNHYDIGYPPALFKKSKESGKYVANSDCFDSLIYDFCDILHETDRVPNEQLYNASIDNLCYFTNSKSIWERTRIPDVGDFLVQFQVDDSGDFHYNFKLRLRKDGYLSYHDGVINAEVIDENGDIQEITIDKNGEVKDGFQSTRPQSLLNNRPQADLSNQRRVIEDHDFDNNCDYLKLIHLDPDMSILRSQLHLVAQKGSDS
ncbi:MAG: hypothetical protein Q4F60_02625 [Candidatus Saccharibacteria bacterium]|nr:hypothetical protein [Candidatus Saccharibacteria bacterium]